MKRRPVLFLLIPLCIVIILFEHLLPTPIIRNHYSKHLEKENYYKILIKEEANPRKATIRYKAKITHYLKDQKWHKTTGDIILYFSKQDSAYNLKYGDEITTNSRIVPIKNWEESSSFDYKRMMKRQRIYDNIFVKQGSWKKISEGKGNPIIAKSKQINHYLKQKILKSNLPKDEAAIAIGMSLSDKTLIETTTRRQFTSSGLAHILCVSGLHIGIVLLAFDVLLKLIFLGKYKLILFRKILLLVIGLFLCFLVGLTPSSLRVVAMMAVLILTKYTSRSAYDGLNSLAVTAFFFIIFNPLILFNLSFQFSFLAVLGIILFAEYREKLIIGGRHNYLLNQITSTAGMTLSAQVFVLPIILLRFKTFPTYFLLANIIVVPFLSIILISIILFLIFGDVIFLGTIIETALHYQLYALKHIVAFIDSLPFSTIHI